MGDTRTTVRLNPILKEKVDKLVFDHKMMGERDSFKSFLNRAVLNQLERESKEWDESIRNLVEEVDSVV